MCCCVSFFLACSIPDLRLKVLRLYLFTVRFPMPRGEEARHLSKYIFIITQDQGNDIVQKCTPRRLLQLMGWNKQKARDREQLTANTSHRLKQSKEYHTGVTISTDETDISTQSKTAKNKRPTTTHHSNRAHLSAWLPMQNIQHRGTLTECTQITHTFPTVTPLHSADTWRHQQPNPLQTLQKKDRSVQPSECTEV